MRTYRRVGLITAAVVAGAALALSTTFAFAGTDKANAPSGSATPSATKTGVVHLKPTDDSFITPGRPTLVNGNSDRLTSMPIGGKSAFLRFSVAGVPAGATVTNATVSLARLGGTNIPGLNAYQTATTWKEATLDAANAPARGKLVSTTPAGAKATLNLKSITPVAGAVSVRLQSVAKDSIARVESSEFVGAGIPQMTVTWSATTTSTNASLLTGADTVTGQFATANATIGPLHAVRLFYSGALPASYAKVGVPAGVKAFISYKTPSANTVPFAKSCPPGTRIIFHHEPENEYNGNGAAFVAQYDQQYAVLKAANPALIVGMAAMSYQYTTGRFGHSGSYLPAASHVDFYAVDTYEAKPTGQGLATDAPFMGWYNLVKSRGKPLVFAEYGVGVNPPGATDKYSAQRATTFKADKTWIAAHPAFTTVLYWYNTGARGDWRFHDAGSIAAWRAIANM